MRISCLSFHYTEKCGLLFDTEWRRRKTYTPEIAAEEDDCSGLRVQGPGTATAGYAADWNTGQRDAMRIHRLSVCLSFFFMFHSNIRVLDTISSVRQNNHIYMGRRVERLA